MSASLGLIWPSLRAAAVAFCPPFEVAAEDPQRLSIDLGEEAGGRTLRLRYRSERGLFLRTYYLVIQAELAGEGPAEPGTLELRRGKLRWKRPAPRDGKRWSEVLLSGEARAALKKLQVERLVLAWEPRRASWHVALETLSGAVTVTFFPPLMTPNPFRREEARALDALLDAFKQAPTQTPA